MARRLAGRPDRPQPGLAPNVSASWGVGSKPVARASVVEAAMIEKMPTFAPTSKTSVASPSEIAARKAAIVSGS